MQSKTLAVAGLTGSFFVAGSVSAGQTLMGIVTEFVDPAAEGWVDDGYDAGMMDTYRIYAQFASAGVSVTAIGDARNDGITFGMKSITTSGECGGGFFNSSFGSDFAPNPLLTGVFPSLLWDTFVTIGEERAQGPGGVPVTAVAPGFAEQAGGLAGNFTLEDTSWYVSDFPNFANSHHDGRVLIAQFTVAEGAFVEGNNWRISGVRDGETFDEFASFGLLIGPSGACCFPFSCEGEFQVWCEARGGTWQGSGTCCADVICDDRTCAADLDGNGEVGFNDLTILLGAWGPCTGCPEDIDTRGEVGFNDLTILLGNWGPCR